MRPSPRTVLHRDIADAMRKYDGEPVKLPKRIIRCDKLSRLNKQQIVYATVVFTGALHLASGSNSVFDLYDLNNKFLLNENARAEIMEVLKRYPQSESLVPARCTAAGRPGAGRS